MRPGPSTSYRCVGLLGREAAQGTHARLHRHCDRTLGSPPVLRHHPVEGVARLRFGVVVAVSEVQRSGWVCSDEVRANRHQCSLDGVSRRPALQSESKEVHKVLQLRHLVGQHLSADTATDCDVSGAEHEARTDHADEGRCEGEVRREDHVEEDALLQDG